MLGPIEALPVRRPKSVDDYRKSEGDQVKKTPALGEGDDSVVIEVHGTMRDQLSGSGFFSGAAVFLYAAPVSRPSIWR